MSSPYSAFTSWNCFSPKPGAVSRTIKDVVEIPAGRVDGVDAAGMPAGVVEKGLLR